MSLGVVVKGPEGIVLAADTRVTLTAQRPGTPPIIVNFDNATKLLTFGKSHSWVGAVTYGEAVIGTRTAHSYMPEFELLLGEKRLSVEEYAKELCNFFAKHREDAGMPSEVPLGGGMFFIVGGYDEGKPYGEVFLFSIPNSPKPEPQNSDSFGMTWGGQLEIISRIVHGYDPGVLPRIGEHLRLSKSQLRTLEQKLKQNFEYTIPYEVLPLQDCIDLAALLIRTTMTAQNLAVQVRGVGGTIELATITRTEGLNWVQKKELHGEDQYERFYRNR